MKRRVAETIVCLNESKKRMVVYTSTSSLRHIGFWMDKEMDVKKKDYKIL
jgi:hypothetical protein